MVTMLSQVSSDLSSFLVFYFIILWMCALILDTLGLANLDVSEFISGKSKRVASYPGNEYMHLPRWF